MTGLLILISIKIVDALGRGVNILFKCIHIGSWLGRKTNEVVNLRYLLSLCLFIPECYYGVIQGILIPTGLTITILHSHVVWKIALSRHGQDDSKSAAPFFNQSNCVIYALIQSEMEPQTSGPSVRDNAILRRCDPSVLVKHGDLRDLTAGNNSVCVCMQLETNCDFVLVNSACLVPSLLKRIVVAAEFLAPPSNWKSHDIPTRKYSNSIYERKETVLDG